MLPPHASIVSTIRLWHVVTFLAMDDRTVGGNLAWQVALWRLSGSIGVGILIG